jgi:hypothetical protein
MFERPDLTDQLFYRWLDYCGPTSGQSGKRHGECKKVKKVLGIVAAVNVHDDSDRNIPYRSQMSGGNAAWLKESAGTGESYATPR